MPVPPELATIDGAQSLYDWFGYWPSFHDAEILYLHLNRTGLSQMAVHTWHMSNRTDAESFYILEKHVVVDFALQSISDLELVQFSHQNVLSNLSVEKKNDRFALILWPCYGLAGRIEVSKISITLRPGRP
jgi:hypothetical protein